MYLPQRAVFLDRDGTLIVDKVYLNDPNQIEYLPNSIEGLWALKNAGYKLIIVTNQSGLARGIVQIENLHKIHERIQNHFAYHGIFFAGFYYAPYNVETHHALRKPNAGMLFEGARHHNIDLTKSWMIGDRMSDVEAGRRAGAKTILLPGVSTDPDSHFAPPDYKARDLLDCSKLILSHFE